MFYEMLKTGIVDRVVNVRALPEITVVHYILISSGLRTSIREIYNNEGIAGFFRYELCLNILFISFWKNLISFCKILRNKYPSTTQKFLGERFHLNGKPIEFCPQI